MVKYWVEQSFCEQALGLQCFFANIQLDTILTNTSFLQGRLTPISFNPVFIISVHPLYIHLYLLLSLAYPPLFLSVPFSIQIKTYLYQPHSIYLSCSLIFPISLLIQIHTYLFQSPFIYLSIFFIYLYATSPVSICQSRFTAISFHPHIFISLYPSSIHLYLFLSLFCLPLSLPISVAIPLSLSQYILCYPSVTASIYCISTSTTFYLFSIQSL